MTDPTRNSLVYPVAAVVLVGWLLSLVAGLINHDYAPLTITTPVMVMLAGYAFGVQIVKGKNGNGGNGG